MRFLYQSGVSLLQGLVVSSVLAGSALIATRLIQDQKKLQKSTESRDQIEQLHRMVVSTLQNREHCRATVSTAMTSAGLSTVAVDQEFAVTNVVSKTTSGGSTIAFQINDGTTWDPAKIYMNGNVSINSMRMVMPKSTDADPAARTLSYPAKLMVAYSRNEGKNANLRTKSGFGGKQIKKYIPIVIQWNKTTNAFDSCYAVQLGETINSTTIDGNNNVNQEFCSNLGNGASLYTWDSVSNKCILKNNVCPNKFVFAGISSTGNAVCYPLGKYLPDLVNTTDTAACTSSGGTVRLTTDATGKVKITCTP